MALEEQRDIVRIAEIYAQVLGLVGGGISYLLFLTAAVLSGWVTYLSLALLGVTPVSILLSAASFAVSFAAAWFGVSILFRIEAAQRLQSVAPQERMSIIRASRRADILSIVGWALGLAVGGLVAGFFQQSIFVPIFIAVGVGLGNLSFYLVNLVCLRRTDPRPVFVGVYLLLTSSLYPYINGALGASDTAAFVLLTVNLSVSYFAVSMSYFVEARGLVAKVLHAARG